MTRCSRCGNETDGSDLCPACSDTQDYRDEDEIVGQISLFGEISGQPSFIGEEQELSEEETADAAEEDGASSADMEPETVSLSPRDPNYDAVICLSGARPEAPRTARPAPAVHLKPQTAEPESEIINVKAEPEGETVNETAEPEDGKQNKAEAPEESESEITASREEHTDEEASATTTEETAEEDTAAEETSAEDTVTEETEEASAAEGCEKPHIPDSEWDDNAVPESEQIGENHIPVFDTAPEETEQSDMYAGEAAVTDARVTEAAPSATGEAEPSGTDINAYPEFDLEAELPKHNPQPEAVPYMPIYEDDLDDSEFLISSAVGDDGKAPVSSTSAAGGMDSEHELPEFELISTFGSGLISSEGEIRLLLEHSPVDSIIMLEPAEKPSASIIPAIRAALSGLAHRTLGAAKDTVLLVRRGLKAVGHAVSSACVWLFKGPIVKALSRFWHALPGRPHHALMFEKGDTEAYAVSACIARIPLMFPIPFILHPHSRYARYSSACGAVNTLIAASAVLADRLLRMLWRAVFTTTVNRGTSFEHVALNPTGIRVMAATDTVFLALIILFVAYSIFIAALGHRHPLAPRFLYRVATIGEKPDKPER